MPPTRYTQKRGSEWGYLDNPNLFGSVTWNSSILGILTLTVKNSLLHYQFFPERNKNGTKKSQIILFSISRNFGHFPIIPEYFWGFPKATEDVRRLEKIFWGDTRKVSTLSSLYSYVNDIFLQWSDTSFSLKTLQTLNSIFSWKSKHYWPI